MVHAGNRFDVALDEPRIMVMNSVLLAKSNDHDLTFAQVVAWKTREEMVLDLELEAAVEPVHPLGAIDVHSSLNLCVEPFVVFDSVGVGMAEKCVHGKVTDGNLNVQYSRHEVRNKDEHQSFVTRKHRR
jgi:hypothetical protein